MSKDFTHDEDKMKDFYILSKEEFLTSYSYLTEEEYMDTVKARLAYLREEIGQERISYAEIAELQSLAKYINKGDTLLLEWAGVPEFEDENSFIDELDANIGFEMSRSTSNEWTPDYREGYIDGLKQARAMFKETL